MPRRGITIFNQSSHSVPTCRSYNGNLRFDCKASVADTLSLYKTTGNSEFECYKDPGCIIVPAGTKGFIDTGLLIEMTEDFYISITAPNEFILKTGIFISAMPEMIKFDDDLWRMAVLLVNNTKKDIQVEDSEVIALAAFISNSDSYDANPLFEKYAATT